MSQPAADVFMRPALERSTRAESLLFDQFEHGPGKELRLQFKALAAMPAAGKDLAEAMPDAPIAKHQVAGTLPRFSTPLPKAMRPGCPEKPELTKSARPRGQVGA